MIGAGRRDFSRRAIFLSLLFHAMAVMAIVFFWKTPTPMTKDDYEIELAPTQERVTSPADKIKTEDAPDTRKESDETKALAGAAAPAPGSAVSSVTPIKEAKPTEPVKKLDAASLGESGEGQSNGKALIPPRIRTKFPPVSPGVGMKGVVLLTAEILEDGHVGRLVVTRSSGSAQLDAAARELAARWRFDAARLPQDGKPVRAMTSILISYD